MRARAAHPYIRHRERENGTSPCKRDHQNESPSLIFNGWGKLRSGTWSPCLSAAPKLDAYTGTVYSPLFYARVPRSTTMMERMGLKISMCGPFFVQTPEGPSLVDETPPLISAFRSLAKHQGGGTITSGAASTSLAAHFPHRLLNLQKKYCTPISRPDAQSRRVSSLRRRWLSFIRKRNWDESFGQRKRVPVPNFRIELTRAFF